MSTKNEIDFRYSCRLASLQGDARLSTRKFSSDEATASPTTQNTFLAATALESEIRKKKKRKRRPISIDPFAPALPPSEFISYQGQDQFKFKVIHQSTRSAARVCTIETPHGTITTPGYVPVATNAALKAVDTTVSDSDLGVELMFCNTYHLMLHPGAETVEDAGGLHKFMSRRKDRPLITDSGGFQAFSLAYGTVHQELHSSLKRKNTNSSSTTRNGNLVLKISEDGITFRSYRDGTPMLLSPESSILAQKSLAADIILPLDELPPYHISDDALAASVARSHRWEARSLLHHIQDPRSQACYGIIHGGSSTELRKRSSEYISSLPFDGFAVGGALGKNSDELFNIMLNVMLWLPRDRPVHVLGIADPMNIPRLATLGCDTFDSCHATRVGRHGAMLTENGNLRVAASGHKSAHRKPIENCACTTCMTYSLSYLHHLVKAREPLAATLLSIHNIYFMVDMMKRLQTAILNNEV
jgi:queuine tRNA-ribosyltransferase